MTQASSVPRRSDFKNTYIGRARPLCAVLARPKSYIRSVRMKTKKLNVIYAILFAVWLIGVVIASVYDLDISRAVANPDSRFGRLLEVAGEPPAILFTSFNFALIASYFFRFSKLRARDIALGILTAVGCVGTTMYTCFRTLKYIAEYPEHVLNIIYTSAISLFIIVFFALTALLMSEKSLKKYFDTACRCAIVGVAAFVIIWLFKLTWGRVRPRQLAGDLSLFTPWYLPQGFTGYFSFPSGHTANATVIFSSVYYLKFLPERLKKYKPFIITLIAAWIAAVAFSRVLVGAHYLSDVLFGAAITLAIVYFIGRNDKNVH